MCTTYNGRKFAQHGLVATNARQICLIEMRNADTVDAKYLPAAC